MYPIAELAGHSEFVNDVAWAPTSKYVNIVKRVKFHFSCFLCTVGDDKKALIWDISTLPNPIEIPILSYVADAEPVGLEWSVVQSDWLAIAYQNKI